jgi:hypothetical protein
MEIFSNVHTYIGSIYKCISSLHYSGRVEGSYSVWQPDGRLMTVGCKRFEPVPLSDPVFFFFVEVNAQFIKHASFTGRVSQESSFFCP